VTVTCGCSTSWLYLGDELDLHQLLEECQRGCADLPPDDRVLESSRTNADDRLPLDPLGRIEGGDGVVEGRDVADVRPQSSVTHPLDDLTQLGTIGLDNEVDRQAVGGRASGGPTMDTSVPPARIRPAD
jgi:hypothetical protein